LNDIQNKIAELKAKTAKIKERTKE